MLALPWRRFDQDLGRGGAEEGLEICGRRLVIGDVSNSSEGTGLFTWVRVFRVRCTFLLILCFLV